jgi:SAM-dependent methyltransferase
MIVESPRIDILGELPAQLDTKIANLFLDKNHPELSNSSIISLKRKIAARIPPQYKNDWAPFTYLYYSANFLKCYLSICSSAMHIKNRSLKILDIGCGGGASTAATVSALTRLGNSVAEVIAVDRSIQQLSVFESVTKAWISECYPATKTTALHCELSEYLEHGPHADVIVISYVTPELNCEEIKSLHSQLLIRSQEAHSFIVFIESDSIHRGVSIEVFGEKPYLLPYNRVAYRSPKTESLGFQISPKFTPSRYQENLIRDYFECWISHNTEQLRELFERDCLYVINNTRILHGIESIVEYWKHNSERQRNVRYSYEITSQTLDTICFQWIASFDRIDTGDHRQLHGMMLLKLKNGKISYLAEAFSQSKTASS